MRKRRGYIEVTVYAEDMVEQIDDEQLLDEVERRKLATSDNADGMEIAKEAYDALCANRPAEAKSILERLVLPKWQSAKRCQSDYDQLKLKDAP